MWSYTELFYAILHFAVLLSLHRVCVCVCVHVSVCACVCVWICVRDRMGLVTRDLCTSNLELYKKFYGLRNAC